MASWKMMASPSVAPLSPPPTPQRKAVPGSYGWPVIGPLMDRLNYFWFEGPSNFFKNRIEKYNSTVFRTNVPPAFPFFLGVNPNVVAVLDVKSYSHLFDLELVEKNVLLGEFKPNLNFTGGMRVCAYLDTAEVKHSQVKDLIMDILRRSSTAWAPSIVAGLNPLWDTIDAQVASSGSAGGTAIFFPLQKFIFSFLSRCLLGADPSNNAEIQNSGHIMIDKWFAVQVAPTIAINSFQPLEEILLHSWTYPFWFVRSDYEKLVNFVKNDAKPTLQRAQSEFNLTEDEAIHNLLFIFAFNAFGGFSLVFPALFNYLESQKKVHEKLRTEVRAKLSKDDVLTFDKVKEMDLINSFVYEVLRMNPPVPSQFGRARKDFDLTSHNAVYAIKKGELLLGYQPVVMRDKEIFDNPDEFVYDRFLKEKGGHELLKYLYWSNGPQCGFDGPNASNKQCPGRDVVPMSAALFLAYMFQRYDEIELSSGTFTVLKKAK